MDVKTLEDISPVVVVPQIHETETTSKMGDYLPIAVFAGVAMLIPWHIMNKK
jgi:hypothetical protein